jgi:hypothetical protein
MAQAMLTTANLSTLCRELDLSDDSNREQASPALGESQMATQLKQTANQGRSVAAIKLKVPRKRSAPPSREVNHPRKSRVQATTTTQVAEMTANASTLPETAAACSTTKKKQKHHGRKVCTDQQENLFEAVAVVAKEELLHMVEKAVLDAYDTMAGDESATCDIDANIRAQVTRSLVCSLVMRSAEDVIDVNNCRVDVDLLCTYISGALALYKIA